jgi:hypothetical protein
MRLSKKSKECERERMSRLSDHALECELHTVLQHLPDERAQDLARLYSEALGKPPTPEMSTKKRAPIPPKKRGGLLDQI